MHNTEHVHLNEVIFSDMPDPLEGIQASLPVRVHRNQDQDLVLNAVSRSFHVLTDDDILLERLRNEHIGNKELFKRNDVMNMIKWCARKLGISY